MKKIKKNEALLWFGSWTSGLGNKVFDYANSVSIVSMCAGKPWVLALYQSSETVVQVILNLVGGAKADSGDRKRIVVTTDILSALICFSLSFFVESFFAAQVMIIANALLAVVYAFNSPTYKAIIREVIERDRIGFFNSVENGGSGLIKISGPIVGVFLVRVIGVRGALIFDGFTFLFSAVSEIMLRRSGEPAARNSRENKLIRDIIEGFKYLSSEREILFFIILASLVNIFLAGYNLLQPYTDVIYKGVFENFYGALVATEAVGGILGSAVSARISDKVNGNSKALIVFTFFTGAPLLLEPVVSDFGSFILCLLPFALSAVALTLFNIQLISYIQAKTNEDYLGRIFAITFTVAVLCMPIGSFLFAALCNTESIMSYYTVGGGIVALAAASYFTLPLIKKT